jgi:hypothetical protein
MAIKLPTPDGKFKPLDNPGIELGCKGFKKWALLLAIQKLFGYTTVRPKLHQKWE